MCSRKIEDLYTSVQPRFTMFLDMCKRANIDLIITCTLRSNEEQAALYSQGRLSLATVNDLRKTVNLPPLTDNQNKSHVTNARPNESMHNFGLAIDICPMEAGKLIWDVEHPVWQKLGIIGVNFCELKWAGNWTTFKEYPHFQFTGGLTLKEIQDGKRPE